MSKEMQRQILIAQLNQLGIFETSQNRSLEGLSYESLRSLLAIEQAVRS